MTYAFSMVVFALFALMCTTAHAAVRYNRIEPISFPNAENPPVKNPIRNKDKPIQEQYPSAVLYGRTCGGTIISPTWILTAGHCTLFSVGREVLAGTNNTENDTGVRRRVKRLVIHPRFTVGPYWLDADEFGIKQVGARWDFLLAELDEPLPIDDKTIAVAKLDSRHAIPEGEFVGYAGYGTDEHGGTMSSHMHGRALEILADNDCTSMVEYYPKDMVCTKGRPPKFDSACNGDSGSGLMSGNVLVGVASWVEDDAFDCRNGARVIFSRVSAVREWIRDVTKI